MLEDDTTREVRLILVLPFARARVALHLPGTLLSKLSIFYILLQITVVTFHHHNIPKDTAPIT